MRYYDITIGSAGSVQNMLGAGGGRFTSHPRGPQNPPDPGALHVEFDLPLYSQTTTSAQSVIRIHGVSLQDIGQAHNLNAASSGQPGLPVTVKGGMGKGLPLADPRKSGLLVSGTLFQCAGNWIGTDQSLFIQMTPGEDRIPPGPDKVPQRVNLPWIWPKGTPMSQAIAQALSTAFPTYKQQIGISDSLTLPNDEKGWFDTWPRLRDYVFNISRKIKNDPKYNGVRISLDNNTFLVYDGTAAKTAESTKNISFVDMIGQPTWVEYNTIQVTCAMRADIHIGDLITLPPGLVTTTPNSFSQFREASAFQGSFQVFRMRHVGSFRQSDPFSWITTIDANVQAPEPPPQEGSVTVRTGTQ